MPSLRMLTVKSERYRIITVLGLLPNVATAVSLFLLKANDRSQVTLDSTC
jgi:hypothetical protein